MTCCHWRRAILGAKIVIADDGQKCVRKQSANEIQQKYKCLVHVFKDRMNIVASTELVIKGEKIIECKPRYEIILWHTTQTDRHLSKLWTINWHQCHRQTDKQTHTHRQTDRLTDRWTNTDRERLTDMRMYEMHNRPYCKGNRHINNKKWNAQQTLLQGQLTNINNNVWNVHQTLLQGKQTH